MYNWFYITEKIWNNAFSFEKRKNKKLWVAPLKKIKNFDEIKLQKDKIKIAFEDFWFDDKLSTNYWLENFYEITWNKKKIFLFDNHNHALYFWYLAREQGLISEKGNILYHIDEHADYRDSWVLLEKTDLESIFNYTNFSDINVGNYIISAEKEGLIWKTIQIRNTKNLEDYLNSSFLKTGEYEDIILNLDLDFFQPDLDFINYDLKKKVILDIAKKASVITVSTSPFFIVQELAIKVFKDLFDNYKKDDF
jgi:hypothetical protein